jgi:hypothetical protein
MTVALPESIPLRREPAPVPGTPAEELAWMGVFIVLLLLVFVAWRKCRPGGAASEGKAPAAGWLGRWMGSLQKKQELRTSLVSSARLTPQHSVHEVTWQGRRLLIGCAPQSIALLAEAPLDESVAQPGLSTNEGKDGTP